MQGNERAEYGTELIKKLSKELTQNYGKGFDYSSLYKFIRFYKEFPEILDSVNPKSLSMLSWTHYRVLLQVEDKKARDWYQKEPQNKLGVSAHYRETFLLSIIIVCSRHRKKSL